MSPKLKVINMSYKPPLKPLILFNTKIPVNQLVVGSIPTAGANKSKGVNGLDHRRPLVFVSQKVINSYKLIWGAWTSLDEWFKNGEVT